MQKILMPDRIKLTDLCEFARKHGLEVEFKSGLLMLVEPSNVVQFPGERKVQ